MLARADGDAFRIAREPTRISDLVASTVGTFAARADGLGVALTFDVAAELVADVDSVRVRQALTNLVDNALREVPAGGAVTVRGDPAPGAVTLAVSDTGPGFAPGVVATAFEPFVRGPERRRDDSGAGLGLAIVAAVARAHGGTVAVTRDAEITTVTMTLPHGLAGP